MNLATRGRHEQILEDLMEKKHVTVRDLASNMAVSEATVRRDLRALADERLVTLVHGGATLPRKNDFSFLAKRQRNLRAKEVIALLAVDLIGDGDQVFIDSGTTCFEMAVPLSRKHGVSVLVHSARLAIELQPTDASVILLGGQYRPERMDVVGPIAHETLEQMRGYMAFIGADGLSIEGGPSAVDIESSHLYRLAVKNAREAVLLVDHTKFEKPSLYCIVPWENVDRVVTDQLPDAGWRRFFREQKIDLIVPTQENESLS